MVSLMSCDSYNDKEAQLASIGGSHHSKTTGTFAVCHPEELTLSSAPALMRYSAIVRKKMHFASAKGSSNVE